MNRPNFRENFKVRSKGASLEFADVEPYRRCQAGLLESAAMAAEPQAHRLRPGGSSFRCVRRKPVIELLVATTNPGKFAEVQAYLADLPLIVGSLATMNNRPMVIEDGATFEENALKKARTLAQYSGHLTLADDSGLEVDALQGAPGIYSARYCGEEGNDEKNNEKLLRELHGIPDQRRTARFVCALALCAPDARGGKEWLVRESCEGRITFAPRGKQGFGYDPLFFFPPYGRTFGEIDRKTKATVSHRGKALRRLTEILPSLVDLGGEP